VTHLLAFIARHGYALLFFWIMAEQAALPLPSGPLLLACGALAKSGRLSLHLIFLCGLAACAIADSAWFILGLRRGAKVVHFICRLALEPDSCVRQTENAFLRYGSRSLLVSKFVPGLNAVAAPLAAISGVGVARFLLFDMLGALIWMTAYMAVGYIFSEQLDMVGDYLQQMGAWAVAVVAGALALWIAWKFVQRKRFLRKLAVARITADELSTMLDAGEDVVVVDVRSTLESEDDLVPGALRIPLEEIEARHVDIPRDRDIILFCS
jgi:membrane protein DedA with SNARE-associated domain